MPRVISAWHSLDKFVSDPRLWTSVEDMDVSENSGTPKSSILIGFSIINHPFWGTLIFGNMHIFNTSDLAKWLSRLKWAKVGTNCRCHLVYFLLVGHEYWWLFILLHWGFCKMLSIKDTTHGKYASLVVHFKKTLQHVPFVAIRCYYATDMCLFIRLPIYMI